MKGFKPDFLRIPVLAAACCLPAIPGCSERLAGGPEVDLKMQPEPAPLEKVAGESFPEATPAVRSPVRAGATRVRVRAARSFFVVYEPQAGLRLEKFEQAAAGRPFAFEVAPLDQKTARTIDNGFHVERAGDMVAAAIVDQLRSLGCSASVSPVLIEKSPPEGWSIEDGVDPGPSGVLVGGTVEFWVEHSQKDGGHVTASGIVLEIAISGWSRPPDGPELEAGKIYSRKIDDREAIAGEKLADAPERARAAASKVLHRAIKTLIADPELDSALAAFAAKSAPNPAAAKK